MFDLQQSGAILEKRIAPFLVIGPDCIATPIKNIGSLEKG